MKIERINDNKIKVEINSEDVKNWNVSIKKLTDNTPEAQELFRHAIKQAEKELAFSVGTSKLFVEAIPLKDEGFVMIISKFTSEAEAMEALTGNPMLRLKNAEIKIKRVEKQKKKESFAIYKFASFDELCSGVGEISHIFIGESCVYKFKDEFYLRLEPSDMFGFYEIDNKISEFSERCKNSSFIDGYLMEYGEVFISFEAVETLMYYFVK